MIDESANVIKKYKEMKDKEVSITQNTTITLLLKFFSPFIRAFKINCANGRREALYRKGRVGIC